MPGQVWYCSCACGLSGDSWSKVLLHDPTAYPPPWNQLDALGRKYGERGNTGQAIRFYELSLKENPKNDGARKKLAEMGKQ